MADNAPEIGRVATGNASPKVGILTVQLDVVFSGHHRKYRRQNERVQSRSAKHELRRADYLAQS
ncbi:MAG: hypothetical protein KDB03_20230 [Planctomycetales bacterium]|nr:hypothetical protein [Planctomycetales bacterium]